MIKKDRSKGGLWNTYSSMISRCYNKKNISYEKYGGKGIIVAEEWMGDSGYENFVKDMGARPAGKSIDRINNSMGYSKNNCRWATRSEQSINQSIQKNNKYGYIGITKDKNNNWYAQICFNRKSYYLGYYKTAIEAAKAYDEGAKKLHGSIAKLNFKEEN